MRSLRIVVTLLFILASTAIALYAQTASTSTVSGTVFDKTGAVVPKASVELTDVATNAKRTTTTAKDGGYFFPAVPPGNYKVAVTAAGFRESVVSGLIVEVGKAALVNVTLEVGEVTQVVEVQAGVGTELQTLDASVGNVLDQNVLKNMPSFTRDATALLLLQPTSIPGFNGQPQLIKGECGDNGGGVAGARQDQNTFMLDGGDATSNMEGTGGYNTAFVAVQRAVVPTPVESLEEFRVQTNNQNVSFARSGGAEVQMVTKRGTNNWHGAAYWYHQNDELNANDWFRNFRGPIGSKTCPTPFNTCDNPELRDNRYGGRLGGPIWKDRTFFFVHEEERHFFTPIVFTRQLPTQALRAGIIKFPDATGVVRAYNLNANPVLDVAANTTSPENDPQIGAMIPSAICAGGTTCDPRQKGLSPAIAAEWGTLPLPNDFTGGDGLRTANFTSFVPITRNEHFAVLRLDHKITSKWNFNASYRYSVTDAITNNQVDIGGISPGCTKGVPCPISNRPLQPRYLVASLTGQITPNLINEFHFDWLRHWWEWKAPGAKTQIIDKSLSSAVLEIWNESATTGQVPINVDTQQARERTWNGRDFTYIDDLSWTKGKHVWVFGGRAQRQHLFHIRNDKVVGGLTDPIYYVIRQGDFTDISVGSKFRPPDCPAGSTTAINCLQVSASGTTQHGQWDRAYVPVLGMVDAARQTFTRDINLAPRPPGSRITQDSIVDSYEIHFADTWRMTRSLTVSYGLSWGVQLPPFETRGMQTMMVDANSGQIITTDQLLGAKALAAANGDVVNPTLGFVPIRKTGRKYPYDPDYTNFGPRLAVAWNPSFSPKTVIRGGWSRSFDRLNGVGIVLTPALGAGFGALSTCLAPGLPDPITGKVSCLAGFNPKTNFRIGVDGNTVPIPQLSAISGTPIVIPGQGGAVPVNNTTGAQPNSVYESRDFRIDPRRQVGSNDSIDFTIQRQLPWNMLVEVGYIGRWARDLYGNIDLNAVPYMFKPKGVNQNFAQAFDIVDAQIRDIGLTKLKTLPCLPGGGSGSSCQPWFEAMLGPQGTILAAGECGMGAHGAGLVWAAIEGGDSCSPGFATGPLTNINTQLAAMGWTESNSHSNYHAGFVTLRKRAGDLTFDANYTLSHSLDNYGVFQACTSGIADAFNLDRTYGPSLFDRRHVFNMLVTYNLPFGKGKQFARGEFADRLFGGWQVSGIYTGATGLPDMVYDDAACGTEFGSTAKTGVDTGLLPIKPGVIVETTFNNPTLTTSGFGSSSCAVKVTSAGCATPGVPNAFANPAAVVDNFRYATFDDKRLGFGAIRGPFRWNLDIDIAKTTRITERASIRFDAHLINAFNHPMVLGVGTDSFFSSQPGADVSIPRAFGVPNSTFNAPRFIQLGIRLDF